MTDRAHDDFNVYADERRARAYATLRFPGTYYLAYRDLPSIVARHAAGRRALDLGCGAGRSTRFLQGLGFEAVGADISAEMVRAARALDPGGDYRLVGDGDYAALAGERFELVLSVFTFDNVPTRARKRRILERLRPLLAAGAPVIHLVSSPEIYVHEWASFSTRDFPENRTARDGDVVRTVILDTPDRRPVDDVRCGDASYREIFAEAGYSVEAVYRPLGRTDDPVAWVTEATVPPWTIYVLVDAAPAAAGRASDGRRRRRPTRSPDGAPSAASSVEHHARRGPISPRRARRGRRQNRPGGVYARRLRQARRARPATPVPSRTSDVGSGTG